MVLDLAHVACESGTLQGHVIFSCAGEIRTRRHWFLRSAAQPLAYRTVGRRSLRERIASRSRSDRRLSATHTGFEPVISTVTGWRPLQTGPMGRVVLLFQRHHRDSNSPKMFCRHLPRHTDWCRSLKSSTGRIRTVDPLFVRQVPSPLGHRTVVCFVERRPWDSNPQVLRPAVFKTASSPIRVTSVTHQSKRRGQESNLRPSGSEPDATTSSCYPGSGNAKDRAMLALTSQARGRGFEPLSPDSKSGSLPLADPRIRFS